MQLDKKKLNYKWVILIVCFFMEFICLGFCSSNAGLYLTAITKALDIERSLFSVRNSIRYVVSTCVSLYFGTLIHKLGIKKMVCIGLAALISSTLINAYAQNVIHFYLGGALLGLGVTFTGGTMAGTIIRRWFTENVGRYTGIAMAANGIGGAVAAQIISPLINEEGNPFGYRNAYKVAALITFCIAIIIIIFLKDVSDDSQPSTKATGKKIRGSAWSGIDYNEAKKKPYFYFLAISVLLTGISLQSIGSISLAHMTDIGLSPSFVATAATVSSLVLTCSKILVGTSYDIKGLRFTMLICQSAGLLSFLLKALLTNTPAGNVMAIIAVMLSSLAMPLETVMLPLLANDLFGKAGYTKTLGIFMAMNSIGLCIGSPLGNLCYDLIGTYIPVLWSFVGIMITVIIFFHFTLTKAYKEKDRIIATEINV